jgi:hypothetical protein
MNKKVFISGSISIKRLPKDVLESIDRIIAKKFEILIGDANGVDKLVQYYCLKKQYFNVIVYSIFENPRNKASDMFGFRKIFVDTALRKGIERQTEKDKAMTQDSTFCFVIWDGKSKGSYSNILRAIELNKKTKVYLTAEKRFLEPHEINANEIEYIFRENNGYVASEVIEYLNKNVSDYFKNSRDLYKYLVKKSLIKKKNNIYVPVDTNSKMFIMEKYRGKPKGVKFSNEFIDWVENELKLILRKDNNFQMTLFEEN